MRLGIKHFREDTTNAIARLIHSTTDVEIDQITQDIASWAKTGAKYDGICRDLAKRPRIEAENQPTIGDPTVAQYDRYTYLGPLFYWPTDITERS